MNKKYLTWLELDSRAFHQNISTIRKLAGGRQIAVAVKANGYGHGQEQIIKLLRQEEIPYIAVHSLDEAVAARRYGWTRNILMVGYIPLGDLDAVFEFALEPTVYNRETIARLGKLAASRKQKVHLHLKVETGTNRQGVESSRLPGIVALLKKHPELHLKGVSTHFANIEDTTDHTYANSQLRRFNQIVTQIRGLGLRPEYRHTACSAALLLFEDTRFELVRPGIAVYGLWPSKETYLSYRLAGGSNNILSPMLAWKTRVIQIKDIPADAFIGYGCSYRTTSRTKLAILPIGYYDGYDRSLSNLAYVLIKGKRAPVRGRICMNLTMVDITDIPGVRLEDPVTLLGSDNSDHITADQMAGWAGSVNYEIMSRIGAHLPRLII